MNKEAYTKVILSWSLPILPSNDFIAAPTAVSSCIMLRPFEKVLLFTIISIFNAFLSSTLSMAI